MSLKIYTITQNGSSDGNVIASPFTIEVHQMTYFSEDNLEYVLIETCTKNGSDKLCANDDINVEQEYALPAMGASKNADLTATLEVTLQEKYPGNWS
jgi:hypothetical protein